MDALRKLCVENNFYTKGTNDEYDSFLKSVKGENIIKEKIYEFAFNIYKHSQIENNLTTNEIFVYKICKIVIQHLKYFKIKQIKKKNALVILNIITRAFFN